MHWLDSAPSREIDPVLDCLTFLARRADRPSSPVLLRAGLALSATGTLPFHQIEPALDQVGMRGEPMSSPPSSGWRLQQLPAIVELTEDRAAVLLEMQGRRSTDLRAGHRRADVGSGSTSSRRPSPAMRSWSRPIRRSERAGERPWDKVRREPLVLVRGLEGPPRILAGAAGRADRQPAGARGAAVHDERLRPGDPQQGRADPVGAGDRRRAGVGFDFTLRLARSQLVDEIGRRLDAKYSQKLFEKVMNLPMAERQGSTGAFAKRVSEYEGVRDFFASTTVVLVVDIVFLLIFLVLITVLAGWLVLVPLVGIAADAVAGRDPADGEWRCGARTPRRTAQPAAFGAGRIDRRRSKR